MDLTVVDLNLMPWNLYFAVVSFLFGACIGSFLNVCIYRIPREQSVVTPRSHCPSCNKLIPWYLNIPLLSYVMLMGKCRFCGVKLTPRYLIVELLTACLFLLVYLKYSLGVDIRPLFLVPLATPALVIIYWLVAGGLILGTFVDFEHLIIPDRVTLGGIVAGLILSGFFPELHGAKQIKMSLLWSALGVVTGAGSLMLMAILGEWIFKKEAMGMGDVKLLGAIGAFFGSKAVLFVLVISSFVGSIAGITMVILGCKKMQSKIPYGPYIALAALIWLFWGENIWSAYINFLMPPIR